MRRIPRKFYLSSATGERFGLNGERSVWLTDPSGLGLELSANFANSKNGFFSPTVTDDVPQGAVYGTLVFTGASPYADYRTFLSWALAAGDALTVIYEPMPGTEFQRRAMLTSVVKTEIEAPGWLRCEATFQALTPWFRDTQIRRDLLAAAGSTKRYPYRYAPRAIYPVDSGGQMRATVQSVGHIPAALSVECRGPIVSPVLRLIGVGSRKEFGRLALDTSIEAGERLLYSSRYLDAYVLKVTADGAEVDLLPHVDLSFEPWLRAPIGEPCTFIMTAATSIPDSAVLKAYDYFWSV